MYRTACTVSVQVRRLFAEAANVPTLRQQAEASLQEATALRSHGGALKAKVKEQLEALLQQNRMLRCRQAVWADAQVQAGGVGVMRCRQAV